MILGSGVNSFVMIPGDEAKRSLEPAGDSGSLASRIDLCGSQTKRRAGARKPVLDSRFIVRPSSLAGGPLIAFGRFLSRRQSQQAFPAPFDWPPDAFIEVEKFVNIFCLHTSICDSGAQCVAG
jgi:hypothetical protein